MNIKPFDSMTLLKSIELHDQEALPEWFSAFAKAIDQRATNVLASNGKMGFSCENPLNKLIETL